jgi:hypothetical protein
VAGADRYARVRRDGLEDFLLAVPQAQPEDLAREPDRVISPAA